LSCGNSGGSAAFVARERWLTSNKNGSPIPTMSDVAREEAQDAKQQQQEEERTTDLVWRESIQSAGGL